MAKVFYRANKSVTGSLLSFNVVSKPPVKDNGKQPEGYVWLNLVRQKDWNSKNRTGSFSWNNNEKNDKSIGIKLNSKEVAGVIATIEKNKGFEAYHSVNDSAKQIKFIPAYAKDEDGNYDYKKQNGYVLSVLNIPDTSKSKEAAQDRNNKWLVGFDFADATDLKYWLIFCLEKINSAIYAEDKKQRQDSYKKNGSSKKEEEPSGELDDSSEQELDDEIPFD